MGLLQIAEATAQATFTSTQVETITNALNTAITNVLNMFVSLIPIFATICGVAFGITFVKKMFGRVGGKSIKA